MKKRNIILTWLLALVFILGACGSSTGTSEDTGSESQATEESTASQETEENTDSSEGEEAFSEEESEDQEEVANEVPTEPEQDINDINPDKQVYVTADWVKEVIDGNEDVGDYVVAEVTWGEAADSPDYLDKHLPGATHFNTDSIEEGPVWNIKEPEEIEQAFLDQGITSDTTLILYGPDEGVDRYAFTALYMGVDNVKVLNGGLEAWENAGYETESGEVEFVAADGDFGVEAPAHPEFLISLEDTADRLENDPDFQLVSTRSENEWLGIESGYSYIPKAGEPAGAIWGRPLLRGTGTADAGRMEDYRNEDGTYKDFPEIAAMWEYEGVDFSKPIAFYCGTAWRSSPAWLMMYERDYEPLHFDGSWNEWQMHDELPVQVGDPDSDDVVYTTVGELDDDKASE